MQFCSAHKNGQWTVGRTDECYQVHYLPVMLSIKITFKIGRPKGKKSNTVHTIDYGDRQLPILVLYHYSMSAFNKFLQMCLHKKLYNDLTLFETQIKALVNSVYQIAFYLSSFFSLC